MKERYQPDATEGSSGWDVLAELPSFDAHEAMQKSQHSSDTLKADTNSDAKLSQQIGEVVDSVLQERVESGTASEDIEDELGKTQIIECSVEDDAWAPEFDKNYRPQLSTQELYNRNQQDLDKLASYISMPQEQRQQYLDVLDDFLHWMYSDLHKYEDQAAELGIAPMEFPSYQDLYKIAYERRRELQLLDHPEAHKKRIKSEQIRLGRELAKDDPHYHDALEGMDSEIVKQNTNAILESVPPRDFDKLAKLMERPDKWPQFEKQVKDVLVRALNLEDANIDIVTYIDEDSDEKGDCTKLANGYRVRVNMAYAGQKTWSYAQVLAHELYHVMQERVQEAGDTEMAELYDFNDRHYGRPNDIGYQSYKNQIKEVEAFRFMDSFLDAIRQGDRRNQETLIGRVKHWWRERDTEKLPETAATTSASPIPASDNAIMMKTDKPTKE